MLENNQKETGMYLLRKSKSLILTATTDKNGHSIHRWEHADNHSIPADPTENIQRGISALKHLLKQRADVEKAMHRPDTGWIDFIWGKKGNPQKAFKGGYGILHIIAKRADEGKKEPRLLGQKGGDVVRKMLEVIAKGTVVNPNHKGNINIEHDGFMAVLSPEMHGKQKHWLLTGFKILSS